MVITSLAHVLQPFEIYRHCARISELVCLVCNQRYGLLGTQVERGFCHCSLIISSHVPVNENMKNLSCLSDSNCSISPAAIWVLNNLFKYCKKLGPATMLFASCSTGSL